MKVTCTYDFDIPDGMVEAAIDKKISAMIAEGRDFEEVVRCANCKNYVKINDQGGECLIHRYCDGSCQTVSGKEFCSRGERKKQ